MFEQYIVNEKGFRNVSKSGEVIGFEVQLRIPYYRGLPMSCVQNIQLKIDDELITQEQMKILVQGETFNYSEISTAINHRWGMTDTITVFVEKSGGLSEGQHKVYTFVSLRISYQPHPNEGADEKQLILEKTREEGAE